MEMKVMVMVDKVVEKMPAMMAIKMVAQRDSQDDATSIVAHVPIATTRTVHQTMLTATMKMDKNRNLAETDASTVNDPLEIIR